MSFFATLKKMQDGDIPSCTVVIAAAGHSKRMDGEDKLFVEIQGAPVLAHTLAAFQSCRFIEDIIIVTRKDLIERVGVICGQYGISKASKIIVGGPTRLVSVSNGVYAVSKATGLIAIHDGARPCISSEVIERTIRAAAKYHAAAPAIPVSSTIKRVRNNTVTETIDRDGLFELQTPQIFKPELIKAALTNAMNKSIDITDDCGAVELIGGYIHITEGSHENIKLTTSDDIAFADTVLARKVRSLL